MQQLYILTKMGLGGKKKFKRTKPSNRPQRFFSRRLVGACMSGSRLEDRAILIDRVGAGQRGLPGIFWEAALSA